MGVGSWGRDRRRTRRVDTEIISPRTDHSTSGPEAMIRNPLGLRIHADPARSPRDQIRQAASLGAKGVVLDAAGDFSPDRLSETGRRELRHMMRTTELTLIAFNLPTRRPFDTEDQLDDRLGRADRAFALAYEVGTKLVLARVGGIPDEQDPRRVVFDRALSELARRADHRGVRLAMETGAEPGETLRSFLDATALPGLAASLDPSAMLRAGHDPAAAVRSLAPWLAHAYTDEPDPSTRRSISLDWVEYLGAFEEVDYRGFLTISPDPARDTAAAFTAMAERLRRF